MTGDTFWGMHVRTPVSTNWPATLAAVHARGPRCAGCGGWTFRPALWTGRARPLLCTRCEQADALTARLLAGRDGS